MVLVFAAMTLALVVVGYGPRWLAVAALLVCLGLSAGLFLFEIDSPEDGFRMPWLRVMADVVPHGLG